MSNMLFMDIDCFLILGNIFGTILNYKRDP